MSLNPSPKNVILYADDDEDDLMLVQEAFEQFSDNVEILTVKDGFEAIDFLDKYPETEDTPCLIILDMNMPRMNGREALIEIRKKKRFADIPVVFFTTSSFPFDQTFAKEYKAGFITKPIEVKKMVAIAEEFMEHCSDELKKKLNRQISG